MDTVRIQQNPAFLDKCIKDALEVLENKIAYQTEHKGVDPDLLRILRILNLTQFEPENKCEVCNLPWQDHYDPELLKYKMGPFGTFGLTADHPPHIKGLHSERAEED